VQAEVQLDLSTKKNGKKLPMSLTIPVLIKASFHTGRFTFSPYGGAYLSIPLTKASAASGGIAKSPSITSVTAGGINNKTVLGIAGGISVGLRLGPGNLFIDPRYTIGLGSLPSFSSFSLIIKDAPHMVSVSLGYELGLGKKRPRITTQPVQQPVLQ
jgi:hypothetical protein